MAKTSAGSDAEDYVVDRDSSAAEATTGSTGSADGTPGTEAKRRRFGRRKATVATADEDEATTTDAGEATGATEPVDDAKTSSAGAGSTVGTEKAGKGTKARKGSRAGKSDKADKAGGNRPARSGAARLARVVTALGLIAVLLAVLLVVQLVKGPGNGSERAAQEDRKEAARSQAEIAVARLFSFNYKTLDADFAAQRAQATGDFANEIDKVTNPAVRPLATKEHVVVQAVSVASATVDDPGPDVQVIVFMNQAVTLDLLPAPRLDRQRLLVSMRLVDGAWKVSGVKAL